MKHQKFLRFNIYLGFLLLSTACVKQQPMIPMASDYETMTVSTSDRTLQTRYPATIKGKQDVDIYPQVAGLITDIRINEGADVRKGETLFILDQVPYRAALETAMANVESAEAAVATAQMTAESKQQLYNENVVSEFDLRTAQNNLRQKKAALAQAKAELTTARNNLSYTEVKSPVNGTAGMISLRIGSLVGPSMTAPLVTVSDNNDMAVYFSMTEKQLLSIGERSGLSSASDIASMPEVELLLSDGTKYPLKGRIEAISGIIDPKTGTVSIKATFSNPDHILRSGGTGNILVPVEKHDCIVIPKEATFELQDKVFVYKVIDGVAKSTPVSVFPLSNGKEYIVESGLAAGDMIVASGAGMLRDGVSIGIKEGGAKNEN